MNNIANMRLCQRKQTHKWIIIDEHLLCEPYFIGPDDKRLFYFSIPPYYESFGMRFCYQSVSVSPIARQSIRTSINCAQPEAVQIF